MKNKAGLKPENKIPDFLLESRVFSVIITDMEGKCTFVNPLCKDRFSFMNIDIIGKPFAITVHEEDLLKVNEVVKQCMDHPGKLYSVRTRKPLISENGFQWTDWEFSLLQGENGAPLGILCLGVDVSEAKPSVKQLIRSEGMFHGVFDGSRNALVLIDSYYKVLKYNEAAKNKFPQVFKSPVQEMADIRDLIHLKNQKTESRFWGTPLINRTFSEVVNIDNHWYQFDFYPFVIDRDKAIGSVMHLHSIDEKRQAEDYWQSLIKSLPDMLFILNQNGLIEDFKADVKDLYSTPELFLKKHYTEVLPGDVSEKYRKAVDDFQRSGEVVEIEYSMVIKGQQKHYQGRLNSLGEDRYIILVRNITERKEAQKKIIEQDKMLRAIYESTKEGISFIDIEYRFRFINQTEKEISRQILGKTPSLGDSLFDYLYISDRKSYLKKLHEASDGKNVGLEGWAGEKYWKITINVVRNPDTEVIGYSILSKDLTESKKGQMRLEESERKYRLMVDLLSEGIILHSAEETDPIVDCNDAAARILGLERAELIGRDSFDKSWSTCDENGEILTTENHPSVVTLRTKKPVRNFIMGVQKKSSDFSWILINSEPVFDSESGQLKNVLVAFSDITKMRNAQLALENREHRLQKTIESIPHPMLIVNEQNEIEFANEDFTHVFEFDFEEVKGKHINLLIPERFHTRHNLLTEKYKQGGGRLSDMGRFIKARTKSGKEIVVNGSLNSFRDDNRNLVIVILQDMTELKRNQDTILKQNESLKSIAWLQSHELRKPLANILGFCNIIESDVKLDISDVKKIFSALGESAREMDQVVHDIVEKTEKKD